MHGGRSREGEQEGMKISFKYAHMGHLPPFAAAPQVPGSLGLALPQPLQAPRASGTQAQSVRPTGGYAGAGPALRGRLALAQGPLPQALADPLLDPGAW